MSSRRSAVKTAGLSVSVDQSFIRRFVHSSTEQRASQTKRMIQLLVNPRRNAVDAPVYTVTVDHPDHETDARQERSVGEFKMQNSRNTQ